MSRLFLGKTIDQLLEMKQRLSPENRYYDIEINRRRVARDAILDLAEQLDAEGLILIKDEPLAYVCQGTTSWLRSGVSPDPVLWLPPNIPDDAEPIYASCELDAFLKQYLAAPLPASPSSVEG